MGILIQLFEDWGEEDMGRTYLNPMHGVAGSDEMMPIWDEIEELEFAVVNKRLGNRPVRDPRRWAAMARVVRHEFGEVTGVSLASVVPTEKYLNPEHLAALVKGAGGVRTSTKIPIVYRHKGRSFISDGNHRAAAEYIKGKRYFKALLIATRDYAEWLKANP